ncbi:MAG: Gx transporter family protein [Gammaproteobacteria bacterium]|jgi:heptaprenyl diphosphate synthase|nr:Gx transporter family protein [Gammaproteobacteria bacterium]
MTATIVMRSTREDHLIAALATLAIAIHVAESALPMPLPGAKPGLANVIVIVALLLYGWKTAAWVSMLRVLAGSIVIGTFLSPSFVLSLSGAVAAMAAVGLVWAVRPTLLGPIGYSVLAAMAHMAAQFHVAWLLFIPHPALFGLLPILMTLALISGLTGGIIVQAALARMKIDPTQ